MLGWRAASVGVLSALSVFAAVTRPCDAIYVPPPLQAIAPLGTGFVWLDDTHVRPLGTPGVVQPLPGNGKGDLIYPWGPVLTEASSSGVTFTTHNGIVAIDRSGSVQALPVTRDGCWQAGSSTAEDAGAHAVVAGRAVVAGGVPACAHVLPPPVLGRQPLFIRPLTGGPWRVLRWVNSWGPAILAAHGSELAVGEQHLGGGMRVTIFDVAAGRTISSFPAPAGEIAFAGSRRLIVTSIRGYRPPLPRFIPGDEDFSWGMNPYGLSLYDTLGRHLAQLGTAVAPPLVDGDHLVTAVGLPHDVVALAVRRLPQRRGRLTIGFRDPERSLVGAALRWPHLALIETTSRPLGHGRFSCGQYSAYHPATKPFLLRLDLRNGRYRRPPPAATSPPYRVILRRCGPPPP